jgi:hypothetical protein
MFSFSAFSLSTLFLFFLPVSLLANAWWWLKQRQSKRKRPGLFRAYIFPIQFVLLVAFTVFIEPPAINRYTQQLTDYFQLSSLQPSQVTSISIETFIWDQPADIASLTQALNQATWYLRTQEDKNPFVPMRVNLATNETLYLTVGQSEQRDGAILRFWRLDKNGKQQEAGIEFFVPGLPARLMKLFYLLPLLPGS